MIKNSNTENFMYLDFFLKNDVILNLKEILIKKNLYKICKKECFRIRLFHFSWIYELMATKEKHFLRP